MQEWHSTGRGLFLVQRPTGVHLDRHTVGDDVSLELEQAGKGRRTVQVKLQALPD